MAWIESWGCTTDTESSCATGSFPDFIAVGSSFSLGFVVSEELPDEVRVDRIMAASPTHLDGFDAFEVLAPGDVTVIAMGPDYTIDMVTLSLRPITDLDLDVDVAGEPADDCTWDCPDEVASAHVVTVGGSATIDAVARWSGTSLGGTLDYEWSTDSDTIELQAEGNSAYVSGLAVGEAWVQVRVGDHAESVRLEIVEAPQPEPDPEPEPDPGSTGIDGLAPTPADDGAGSDDGSGSDSGGTGGSDDGDTGGGESSTGGQ